MGVYVLSPSIVLTLLATKYVCNSEDVLGLKLTFIHIILGMFFLVLYNLENSIRRPLKKTTTAFVGSEFAHQHCKKLTVKFTVTFWQQEASNSL